MIWCFIIRPRNSHTSHIVTLTPVKSHKLLFLYSLNEVQDVHLGDLELLIRGRGFQLQDKLSCLMDI